MKKVILFLLAVACAFGCMLAGCNKQQNYTEDDRHIDVYYRMAADNSWTVYYDKTHKKVLYAESLILPGYGDNYTDQVSTYYASLTEYYGRPATVYYFKKYYAVPVDGGYEVSEVYYYHYDVDCDCYKDISLLLPDATYSLKSHTIHTDSGEQLTAHSGYTAQAIEHTEPCGVWDLQLNIT